MDQGGGSMGHPWRTLFSPRGGSESVSPSLATHLGLSQILSNNVHFLVILLTFSYEGPICIKGAALFCLAQAETPSCR